MGLPRLHTTSEGDFKATFMWDLLIERINLEYEKTMRDFTGDTIIIEFSRGMEHGGFGRAFDHLSEKVLSNLAILYVNVSWDESLRKNRKRFNPDRPDSILEHGLSDEKLEKLYRHSDWESLTAQNPDQLEIEGISVPYVVFENEDDVTTDMGEALGERLEKTLTKLWSNYNLSK
jgi:hypothetical protein